MRVTGWTAFMTSALIDAGNCTRILGTFTLPINMPHHRPRDWCQSLTSDYRLPADALSSASRYPQVIHSLSTETSTRSPPVADSTSPNHPHPTLDHDPSAKCVCSARPLLQSSTFICSGRYGRSVATLRSAQGCSASLMRLKRGQASPTFISEISHDST